MTHFDLSQLRKRSLRVTEQSVALLMTSDVRQPVLEALEHAIGVLSPDDRILRFDVAELMADRVGLAKASTSRLLIEHDGVTDLRLAAPEGQFLASWLRDHSSISDRGADTLAIAMMQGDFDTAATLTADVFRDPSGHEDTVHTRGQDPLREADARVILETIANSRADVPIWILLDRLEEALISGSPKCRGFRTGLERIVAGVLPQAPIVMVATCWAGALNEVRALDRSLAHDPIILESTETLISGGTDPRRLRDALAAVCRVRLATSRFDDVWTAVSDHSALALVWPTHQDDPARYAVRVAGDLAQSLVGGPLVVVLPEWAMAPSLEKARSALLATFPALTLIPLSTIEAAHLAGSNGGEPSHIAARLKRDLDHFFAPDAQEPQ